MKNPARSHKPPFPYVGTIIGASAAALLAVSFVFIYRDAARLDFSDGARTSAEQVLPDTISIAFYNVENLFDFNLDGTEFDEYKPGWFGWTEEVQRIKLNNVASVVAAIDADVMTLCEIENENALRELQTALDRMGVVYPYSAVAPAPNSATVTAILSKLPIRKTRAHRFGTGRNRTILEAHIGGGEGGGVSDNGGSRDNVVLFVNHWPSKRSPESRRLEAANVLRARIDSLPAGTDYLIIGDLNANYNEFSTFHTAGFNDTRGRTGINHVLRTIVYDNMNDANGADDDFSTQTSSQQMTSQVSSSQTASSQISSRQTSSHTIPRFVCRDDLSNNCKNCHYNLWLELDERDRMSYIFRGARNTLDHIIAPAALFDDAGFSYLDGSFSVFMRDGYLLRDGVPFRWQMRFRGSERFHVGAGYSDHLPLVAKIVRASLLRGDVDDIADDNIAYDDIDKNIAAAVNANNIHGGSRCIIPNPNLQHGDFAVTVDGWVSGDSRFIVERDTTFALTGTHSLRVTGMHATENRTAARLRLPVGETSRSISMSIRGSGNLSIRLRRHGGGGGRGGWVNYNAPDFSFARSIRYRPWSANTWRHLRFPLPPVSANGETDVEIELRAGRGVRLSVWVDRVRADG